MKTYKLKKSWTKTKLINYIKKNFKGKSTDSYKNCAYRGPNGRKCAVGLFIPEDKYSASFEGIDAYTVIKDNKLNKYMPFSNDGMDTLQRIHDHSDEENTLKEMISFIKERVK